MDNSRLLNILLLKLPLVQQEKKTQLDAVCWLRGYEGRPLQALEVQVHVYATPSNDLPQAKSDAVVGMLLAECESQYLQAWCDMDRCLQTMLWVTIL